jgi:hypothetical protein
MYGTEKQGALSDVVKINWIWGFGTVAQNFEGERCSVMSVGAGANGKQDNTQRNHHQQQQKENKRSGRGDRSPVIARSSLPLSFPSHLSTVSRPFIPVLLIFTSLPPPPLAPRAPCCGPLRPPGLLPAGSPWRRRGRQTPRCKGEAGGSGGTRDGRAFEE